MNSDVRSSLDRTAIRPGDQQTLAFRSSGLSHSLAWGGAGDMLGSTAGVPPSGPRLAVLVPCDSEALTVVRVVEGFRAALPDAVIDVYDDNSTAGTAEVARDVGAVVRTERRQGKRNLVLTPMVRSFFGRETSDMLSGYEAMSRRFVTSLPALSNGFEIETELTVHALEIRMPTGEISASCAGLSAQRMTDTRQARVLGG